MGDNAFGLDNLDLQAPASSTVWGGADLSGFNFQPAQVSPVVDNSTLTAGQAWSNVKDAWGGALSLGSDIIKMKTSADSMKLQNQSANLQYGIASMNNQTQAAIANANLQIAQDKVQQAQVQSDMQLGIARYQSQATLAAVQANPLSSQLVTGKGLLGNLTADGKISLMIGLFSIWLMMRQQHKA